MMLYTRTGLFNALTGLGGGGQVDPTTSANANSTLYATFAVGAFFSGYVNEVRGLPPIYHLSTLYSQCLHLVTYSSINNKLGSRLTLLLGITGYSLFIGSYL